MNISHNIVSRIQERGIDDVFVKTNEDNDTWFDIECGGETISLPKSIISLLTTALDKQTETTY